MLKGNGTTNMHKMNLGFPTIAPFDTEEVGKNENENADGGWGADSKPPSSKEQSRDRSTWSAHALTQSERKDENKFVVNAEGSPLRKELLQSEAVEQAEVRPRKSRARQDVPNVGSAEIAGQIATAVNEGDYHYTSRVIAAGQERTWPPSSNGMEVNSYDIRITNVWAEPYKDQARIPESKQEDSLNTNGPGVVLGTVKAGSVHGDEENRLQLVLREDMPAAPNPNVFDMNVAMRLEGSLAQEPNGTPVEFTVERDNDGSIIFVARPKLRRIDAHATPQAEEKSEMAQPERKGTNGEVARYDPEGNIDVDQSSAKLDTPRLKPVEEKVKSQAIPDDVFEYMRIMWKEDPMLSQEFEEIWNQQPERQNELIDKMHQNMMLERQKLEGRKRLEALRRENTPAAARVLFEPDGAREPPSANMKRTAVKHEDTEGSRHHSISVNAAKTNEQPKPSGARLPVSGGPIKNTLMEIPQKNTLEAIPEPELIEISPESIARYYYIRKHRDGQGTANVSASDTNAPTILQFQSFLTSEFRDHPELIDLLRRKFSANPERKLVYVETLHDAMLAQAKTRSFPNDREPHVVQQKEDNAPQQKENKPQQTENKPQPGVKGKKAQKGIERYFQTPDEEPYDMEEFLKNPNAGIQW